ncbi:stalk domain-containing protein [Papillibacter cinnamivorans]|uniref:Copper amine oxidase N-terminal domain-containing protein n=1 Tax=Papillibacter cinnamivorans DSM 12816 TaxID=1122930 RepID=A0A1W2D2W9_9FIRM|nr:stalk domain-containing protein [Papillibacter cinnamivorans]SMC91516.1 Copper amine oxidase N-terminal domain-containing protein [Papillibacter cinnamivorans DSM 12816]
MKTKVSMFLAGALIMALMVSLGGASSASAATKAILADYMGITVRVDGEVLNPTDVNGNPTEPFAVDGTTYLPARAIADACGYDVSWDQDTKTVDLTKKAEYTTCYGEFAVPALENILDGSEYVSEQIDTGSVTYIYPVSSLPEGSFIGDYVVLLGKYGFEYLDTTVEDGIEKVLYKNGFTGVIVSLYYDGGGDYYCVHVQTVK